MAPPASGHCDSVGRCALPVLSRPLIAIAAGAVFGFLSGIGIGGGSLLMLWLTLAAGLEPFTARCINLMFFIPTALCSSIFRWRQGCLPVKKLPLPVLTGCVLAGVFSLVSGSIDTGILKKIFGGLLILTGIKELCYRQEKNR